MIKFKPILEDHWHNCTMCKRKFVVADCGGCGPNNFSLRCPSCDDWGKALRDGMTWWYVDDPFADWVREVQQKALLDKPVDGI